MLSILILRPILGAILGAILGLALYGTALAATTLTPLSLTISQPAQNKGLTVFAVTLPAKPFADYAGSDRIRTSQWFAQGADDNLQQIYLAHRVRSRPAKATENKPLPPVYILGLMRVRQDSELRLYYLPDATKGTTQSVFSVLLREGNAVPGDDTLDTWVSVRNKRLFKRLGERLKRINRRRPNDLLLSTWARLSGKIYQGKNIKSRPSNRRRGGQTDLFSLFSGEAAIQETLQQQLLQGKENTQAADITLSELEGPKVPSHPFEKLLGGAPGGNLPIARLVPPARYFVQVENPRAMLDWLEQSAQTGHRLAGIKKQTYLQHDLIKRYLAKLYLPYPLARQLSSLVRQAALFGPDLFLTHGSELTLVVDSGASAPINILLRSVLGKPSQGGVQAYGETARPAYFAGHDNWLIFSTSKAEAGAALELARRDGKGSLGDSAEFRYMLSLLPPKPDQQGAFVYLSDPFIRAMVGPRIKIAQVRRHWARAHLNLIGAAASLYRLDRGKAATLEALVESGYVEESWLQSWEGDHITLDEQGVPHSSLYGSLARMSSLNEVPVDKLSRQEVKAYQQYVTDYSSFWQQFFDPIGIRLEVGETLKIETLILPLVQNSIYQQVRAAIGGAAVNLAMPTISPRPISVISLKRSPELRALFISRRRHSDGTHADLGEALHIAFYDSDPLLVLGSLEILGGISGPGLSRGSFSGMMTWALLGAMLTQPVAVFVELQNPAAVPEGSIEERRLVSKLLSKLNGLGSIKGQLERQGDAWIFTLNAENILRFHLYIQRAGNYLVISNRRMDFQADGESTPILANARLQANFDEMKQLRPTLDLHQLQHQRQAALWNQARLLPFLLLGAPNVEQAMQAHQRFYGNRPQPMSGDSWHWDPLRREIRSSLFGSAMQPKLPDTTASQPLESGPFSNTKHLDLSFRLEDEGVRVVLEIMPR